MKITRTYLLLFTVLFFPSLAGAQEALHWKDTLRIYKFQSSGLDSNAVTHIKKISHDTATTGFQRYELSGHLPEFYATLGNAGLAARKMTYDAAGSGGFVYGENGYSPYDYRREEIPLFSSISPFTELFYATGSRKEQNFRVTHHHNIGKRFTVGTDYRLINAQGQPFLRQRSNHSNFYVNGSYHSKSNRYFATASYIHNRLRAYENGGISSDEAYELSRAGSTDTSYTFLLKNADTDNKNSAVTLTQYFSFYRPIAATDSTEPRYFNAGRIIHSFSYRRERNRFEDKDPNGGFYPFIASDSSGHHDSTTSYTVKNRISWTNSELNREGRSRMLRLFAGVSHVYAGILQMNRSYYLHDLSADAGFLLRLASGTGLSASYTRHFSEDFSSDYCVKAAASQKIGKRLILDAEGSVSEVSAPWIYNHFSSKYYSWENDFTHEKILRGSIGIEFFSLKMRIAMTSVSNPLYFDYFARPRQLTGGIAGVFSADIIHRIRLGKWELHTRALYQNVGESSIVSIPALCVNQDVYFGFHMFKRALFVQPGLSVLYHTSYTPMAWMPATGNFYLQNEARAGNYPYADFFINLKIKRANLFLMLTHLNAGLNGYGYYTIAHYPMQDRAFKFGVSWRFYD